MDTPLHARQNQEIIPMALPHAITIADPSGTLFIISSNVITIIHLFLFFRPPMGCKAKITLNYNPITQKLISIENDERHVCTLKDQKECMPVIDIRAEVRTTLEDYANTLMHLRPAEIARKIHDEYEAKYNGT